MTSVIFYEKPGCINNTKQKALLTAAGHNLEVHNLLTEKWTPEKLRSFFGVLPVSQWFNRTAPQVKSGEVIPEELDTETALNLMVQNPLLIRRPLMQVGERKEVGFDSEKIDAWIGLNQKVEDLETCPRN
jgi:nitrogenase-associated protein